MKRALPALAAIAALATPAAAAPAENDRFGGLCADLQLAVDAAYERPAFESLAADPARMRRFGPACTLSGAGVGRRLSCEWLVAPVSEAWRQLNDAIAQCFPQALRMAEAEDVRVTRFRFGTIAIHTGNRNFGFRGGSYVSYSVMRLPVHR